jgi:hypothetical protein
MDEISNPAPLAKAIRSLTIAVWCLCIAVVALIGLYVASFWMSARAFRGSTTMTRSTSDIPRSPADVTQEKPFHEMSPDEMVAKASVILLTSYQDEGRRYKAVVAEILKQNPGTTLYYAVGDEYPILSREKQDGVSCGDGQVVFMAGSPATMRSSYSFDRGRIGGLGDMPLTTLRAMVASAKKPG